MNNIPSASSLSASVRVYQAMLVAYPKKFREHYETQMVQVFRDSCREAYHHSGIPGVVDLWIHTLFDLVFTALNERIMERSQYMFSPKVILWGGVAGVFSGLFWILAGLSPEGPGLVLALVLGLGGLVGLYSRQAGQGGKLGLVGFTLGIISTVAMLVADWIVPDLGEAQGILILSLGFLTLGIGLALLGIISLQAKTLHRLRGLPLVMGLLYLFEMAALWIVFYIPFSHGQNPFDPWNPTAYLPVFALFVLIGIGWMGLGITLAAEGDAQIPVAQPPPNSA